MDELHMKVGSNLGEILLDIAQNKILDGNPEEAISTYVKSLCGFTEEYALMCLKNDAVIITTGDCDVELSDEKNYIDENKHRVYDWNRIINNKLDDINIIRDILIKCIKEFNKIYHLPIDDYSILDVVPSGVGVHNIAAKIIAGGGFDGNLYDNGERVWEDLIDNVEYDNAEKYEKILYWTVKYVENIRNLHKSYIKFEKIYSFLMKNGMIERIPFIELYMENLCHRLCDFADTRKGYYHPMCNTKLREYKVQLYNDVLNTSFGNEYCSYGILKKNIMDGYDAGWLSPDGDFYGDLGETRAMIHMNIADDLFKVRYASEMEKDGVTEFGNFNPDSWLDKNGWIKIHHDDIYGSFIGERDPKKRTKDFPYHYCPTDIQIKMVCEYADKFYGGKFYTEANALGRDRHPEPVSTYKVRQMDEFKLHEQFGF